MRNVLRCPNAHAGSLPARFCRSHRREDVPEPQRQQMQPPAETPGRSRGGLCPLTSRGVLRPRAEAIRYSTPVRPCEAPQQLWSVTGRPQEPGAPPCWVPRPLGRLSPCLLSALSQRDLRPARAPPRAAGQVPLPTPPPPLPSLLLRFVSLNTGYGGPPGVFWEQGAQG